MRRRLRDEVARLAEENRRLREENDGWVIFARGSMAREANARRAQMQLPIVAVGEPYLLLPTEESS